MTVTMETTERIYERFDRVELAQHIAVLTQIVELIQNPRRHTRHVHARDADGNPVSFATQDATSFCLQGALCRVTGAKPYCAFPEVTQRTCDVLRRCAGARGYVSTASMNDLLGHRALIRVLHEELAHAREVRTRRFGPLPMRWSAKR